MTTSCITAIASGRTMLGFVPALSTVKRSPASCRNRPSAICDRAELPVQRMSTRFFSMLLSVLKKGLYRARRKPVARPVAGGADGKHDRDFDQDADDGRQSSARFRAEQGDSRRDSQLEKVRCPDERTRRGDSVLHFQKLHEAVSKARVEINLKSDRHCDEHHVEEAPRNVIRLEGENQNQRAKQSGNRDRREFRQQRLLEPGQAVLAHEKGSQEHTSR